MLSPVDSMHFHLLGPLEVRGPQGPIRLGGTRRETALALLVLHADRVVVLADLIDAVWDEDPPANAVRQVRNIVSALRCALRELPVRLVTESAGYRLRTEPDAVDVEVFRRAVTRAVRMKVADPRGAAEQVEAALALWRGPALVGLAGTRLRELAVHLDERRLRAWEELAELRLELDDADAAADALTLLVAQNPARETLARLLMLALYRSGRRLDALEVYHQLRAHLREELGLSPGPEVLRAYEQIVRQDTLGVRAAQRPTWLAQPPPDLPDFVGRAGELDRLAAAATAARDPADGRRAAVISGAPGTGKTSLATRFAHRAADQFADGVVFLSLQDADLGTLAGRLARALGTADAALPPDAYDRVALFRSLATQRSLLIVLDNATDEAQVRPLIAPGPGSFTIITSRNRLGGLGSAHRLHLDVPEAESALQLLARIVGDDRVRREPHAAAELIAGCGRLPLAIRVAGNRIDSWPDWSLQHLNGRLRDERERLGWLRIGDLDVRSAFAVSYAGLRPQASRLFRRLALAPGPDFDADTATVLMGTDATVALDELSDACLIETVYAVGHYRFHDLLRLFALECLDDDEPPDDRRAALRTVVEWLLGRASAASSALSPTGAAGLAQDSGEPLSWLDGHWPHTLAAVQVAGRSGLHVLVSAAVDNLVWYADLRCAWPDLLTLSEWSIAAAHALGGGERLATALNGRGLALHGLGRFAEAIDVHRHALEVSTGAGSVREEAVAADWIGLAYVGLDQPELAIGYHRRHLELTLLGDDQWAQASAYSHLGQALRLLGKVEEAIDCYEHALRRQRRLGNKRGAAMAVNWLSLLHCDQERFDEARTGHEAALAVFTEAGDVWGSAAARYGLGRAYRGLGRSDLAGKEFALAAEMFEAVVDARWVGLARTALEQG